MKQFHRFTALLGYAVIAGMLIFVSGCSSDLDKADKALKDGEYEKAVELYNQVLGEGELKASGKADIYIKIGRAYDGLERTEFAVEAYQNSIDLKPDNSAAYLALARDLEKLGRYDEEIHALRNSLVLEGHNPITENMLGNAYAIQGQYMNALN
ncbi:MAG TPA: tetratricopeptide repeat protein, partial [Nitrospirota bacterium]